MNIVSTEFIHWVIGVNGCSKFEQLWVPLPHEEWETRVSYSVGADLVTRCESCLRVHAWADSEDGACQLSPMSVRSRTHLG